MNAVTPPPHVRTQADTPSLSHVVGDDGLAGVVHRQQAAVWRYLRYLGADPTEADDLAQETFLAVARSRYERRGPGEEAAYVRTVARNQLLMHRRRERRSVVEVDLAAAEAVWAQRAEGWDEQVVAVRECVERLDGRARQAIDLAYREGAAREAVAERLGMKADGVKTLLRRTRELLRECVERSLASDRR